MIIPRPLEYRSEPGAYQFQPTVTVWIAFHTNAGYAHFVAEEFAQRIRVLAGSFVSIREGEPGAGAQGATIILTDHGAPSDLGEGGYTLTVAADRITLRATTEAGLFYAGQSFIQLLNGHAIDVEYGRLAELPCISILDKPRFGWRGFMLDSVRHFQPIETIYKIVNQLAALKLNRFHWHLTDDQGWRIEVLGYPRLTSVGAWRNNGGGRYGGFYTQQQIRELVDYARMRKVTIIPEIEMPGHCLAALAAYPELGCEGAGYQVAEGWGKAHGVFCAGHERTFQFIEYVLDEVTKLFRSKYLHIGGDKGKTGLWDNCPECRRVRDKNGLADESRLQRWFMDRIAHHVESLPQRMIARGDNLEAGSIEGQIVQGCLPGQVLKAAQQGLETINSTNEWVNLDHPVSEDEIGQGKPDWMPALPLEKVHAFNPIPEGLKPGLQKHILGSETNLWTEYIPDETELQRQLVPRLQAFSEVVWSGPAGRDFEDFKQRLRCQGITT